MKLKLLPLAAFIALITFASCKKTVTNTVTKLIEDSTVQTAADTLSASVGGSTYLVYNDSWGETGTDYNWNNNNSIKEYYFEMGAQDSLNYSTDHYLEVDLYSLNGTVTANKTYGLSSDTTRRVYLYYYNNTDGDYESGYYKQVPATATITSINGNVIKGTFQGTLFQYGDTTSATTKVVTNGTFTTVL